jgi:hypothetical protein
MLKVCKRIAAATATTTAAAAAAAAGRVTLTSAAVLRPAVLAVFWCAVFQCFVICKGMLHPAVSVTDVHVCHELGD